GVDRDLVVASVDADPGLGDALDRLDRRFDPGARGQADAELGAPAIQDHRAVGPLELERDGEERTAAAGKLRLELRAGRRLAAGRGEDEAAALRHDAGPVLGELTVVVGFAAEEAGELPGRQLPLHPEDESPGADENLGAIDLAARLDAAAEHRRAQLG